MMTNPPISPLPPPKVDARSEDYAGRHASLEKLVDSRLFITTARVLMMLASAIGLPAAGLMMLRVINSADKIVVQVEGTDVKLQLLEQTVRLGMDQNKTDLNRLQFQITDHEGRIRYLERRNGTIVSPN